MEPTKEEVSEAQQAVEKYRDRLYPTGEDRAALCQAATVLDRALRASEARREDAEANHAAAVLSFGPTLEAAEARAASHERMSREYGEQYHKEFERAEKAERELAEAKSSDVWKLNIELARKADAFGRERDEALARCKAQEAALEEISVKCRCGGGEVADNALAPRPGEGR